MKLYASNNSELMEITRISRKDNTLVVEGTMMGAMPIRTILKPAELRSAIRLMDFKTILFALTMLFRNSA